MNAADVAAGIVAGAVVASVFWVLILGKAFAKLEEELKLAAAPGEVPDDVLLDELEDWDGWGDIPPIPPHGGGVS